MDFAAEAVATLKNAAFPVYAVPPSQWPGDVMVGGSWGSSTKPLDIDLRYDDDLMVERPTRRIEVTSTGIVGLSHRSPQDRFLLWEHSYSYSRSNRSREPKKYNATMVEGQLVPRVVHLPSAGPRTLLGAHPFGDGFQMERIAFDEYPDLRLLRAQMVEAEVLLLAWGHDDDYLVEFMSKARPINADARLFAEIERAEFAAWDKINRRKGRSTR